MPALSSTTVALVSILSAVKPAADEINTKCDITLDPAAGAITESHLTVSAKIPGISKEQFDAAVAEAKANCPISKLLNANITHEATLL